jgi:hypothetical protein
MKRKPPTGNGPLARAYRAARNDVQHHTRRGHHELAESYLLLAALAAWHFWLRDPGRQADLWLDLIERLERLSKEDKP